MIAAHIAGIPVEETALSFGPLVALVGGLALARMRANLGRLRRSARHRTAGNRRRSPSGAGS
jgi:hypothetical protein